MVEHPAGSAPDARARRLRAGAGQRPARLGLSTLDELLDHVEAFHLARAREGLTLLEGLRPHLTGGHRTSLVARALDAVLASLRTGLAQDTRVLVPHLRRLAAGESLGAGFATVAALRPVLEQEQRHRHAVLAALLGAIAERDAGCADCATAALIGESLVVDHEAYRALTQHHLFPLALALERGRWGPPSS